MFFRRASIFLTWQRGFFFPNRASELLWHYLLKGWCEPDVDSENFKRSVKVYRMKVHLLVQ